MTERSRVAAREDESALITVVVPTLDEAPNIERTYERVKAVFDAMAEPIRWEMVITDNRSTDGTFDIVRRIASADERVRGFRFSRNVGFQRSILAAYLLARGDAVVQLDADLQDPPELIERFIALWRGGADVVYGVRRERPGESRAKHLSRKLYYRLADRLSDDSLPHDAGDFRLIDRSVVEVLRRTQDATPYLRGAIASIGFEQIGVEYDRSEREAGTSKFSFGSLVRLGSNGIINHSTRPLELAGRFAVFVMIVAVLGSVAYLVARLTFGRDWPAGFATIVLVQLVSVAVNAMFLAIIGAYVGQILKQSKPQPLVIIDESTGPETRSAMTYSTIIRDDSLRADAPGEQPAPDLDRDARPDRASRSAVGSERVAHTADDR